jgi:alpha-1,2-mannosyltransferase
VLAYRHGTVSGSVRDWPRSRIAALVGAVALAVLLLPVGARVTAEHWHNDALWPNALRSLGGLDLPYDFRVFLDAAHAVRSGDSPYVDPGAVQDVQGTSPYVYPPLLAVLVVPFTVLPEKVAGSSAPGMAFSLLLLACVVATLLVLDVRDWRCYPVALLYPPTLENVELGAIGPVLGLLVALAWRYRDRVVGGGLASGAAIVLKVFLWPLLVWLAATRRLRSAAFAVGSALALALVSWAVIGFKGVSDYPVLVRKLSDLEAVHSYSGFAVLRWLGLPDGASRAVTILAAVLLLGLAWHVARSDRLEGDRRSLTLVLAAAFVVTPIVWLHYLVLLVVPIALARPRLSGLWLVPLALTVTEALGWYRGWPNGEGRSLVSVAAVVTIVFAVAARGRRGARAEPRGAPEHA